MLQATRLYIGHVLKLLSWWWWWGKEKKKRFSMKKTLQNYTRKIWVNQKCLFFQHFVFLNLFDVCLSSSSSTLTFPEKFLQQKNPEMENKCPLWIIIIVSFKWIKNNQEKFIELALWWWLSIHHSGCKMAKKKSTTGKQRKNKTTTNDHSNDHYLLIFFVCKIQTVQQKQQRPK